jgi:hypothetical protein
MKVNRSHQRSALFPLVVVVMLRYTFIGPSRR